MKTTKEPTVGIIMGSKSDWKGVMEHCSEVFKEFGINHDERVISAHRTPKRLEKFIEEAEKKYWNQIHIISDFKLDVNSKYPLPEMEKLAEKPKKLSYPIRNIQFSFYGLSIEKMIKKAIETQKEVQRHYEQYNFHLLTQVIHGFCVNELGAFYLDVIKDRQYTCKKDSKERISAQQSMYFLLKMLLT